MTSNDKMIFCDIGMGREETSHDDMNSCDIVILTWEGR
jgi:hypothetical protein